jgi:hypothetical protein
MCSALINKLIGRLKIQYYQKYKSDVFVSCGINIIILTCFVETYKKRIFCVVN